MSEWPIHARLDGPIVVIGFGSIGKGFIPLVQRHIAHDPKKLTVIAPDATDRHLLDEHGLSFVHMGLTQDNYVDVLKPLLTVGPGPGFLVNLSVDVSCVALAALAQELGAFYIDTCIEPWPGAYTDPRLTVSQRSNYALREKALELKRESVGGPTGVITCGANPGMVSWLMKQALLNVATDCGIEAGDPRNARAWSELARRVGLKGIHIAERDTQQARLSKQQGVFVNTWSVDGFISEGLQPAELGWGTHEKHMPPEGRHHDFGSDAAIYLLRPGAGTRVRSWTPKAGPQHGWLITHSEAISIAAYLSVRVNDRVVYRPTCHYAYHPCDDAVLSLDEITGRQWQRQSAVHILTEAEIVDGFDELGVLLYGHAKNAYWYGSRLSIQDARKLAPYQNATGLQVTSAVIAGMVYAIENPNRGIIEPEEMDFRRCLDIQRPYLGTVEGVYTNWTPLDNRSELFPEDVDRSDPWQFKNVIVR